MSKFLKSYYQNTRGLRTKIIQGLKNRFTLADYDCVCLTEIWLNDSFNSSEIFNETYNVFRADRTVDNYNKLRINRPNVSHDEDVVGGGAV